MSAVIEFTKMLSLVHELTGLGLDLGLEGSCLGVHLHDNKVLKIVKFFLNIVVCTPKKKKKKRSQNLLRSQRSAKTTKNAVLCIPGQ